MEEVYEYLKFALKLISIFHKNRLFIKVVRSFTEDKLKIYFFRNLMK